MTDEVVTSRVEKIYAHMQRSLTALGYNDLSSIREAYVAGIDSTLLAISEGETAKKISEAANRIDGRLV